VLFCGSNKKGVSPVSKSKFFREIKSRYIAVDNPILTDIDPVINGKQTACYGNIDIRLPMVEPPEERDI
jgi:hypothetical protein